MRRFVWVAAIAFVLVVITFVTLIQWVDAREPVYETPEYLTMAVDDKGVSDG